MRHEVGRSSTRTTAWVRSLACAAALLAPLALAESPSLALPTTGPAPTTVVRDVPQPLPNVIDVVVDTALAQADRLPAEAWELEALALKLAFDLPGMHAFVRDHGAFDTYPCVLRGAQGTLAARAGNAWDQALLLHALIDANGCDVLAGRLTGGPAEDPSALVRDHVWVLT